MTTENILTALAAAIFGCYVLIRAWQGITEGEVEEYLGGMRRWRIFSDDDEDEYVTRSAIETPIRFWAYIVACILLGLVLAGWAIAIMLFCWGSGCPSWMLSPAEFSYQFNHRYDHVATP